jgi:hypothetical protein
MKGFSAFLVFLIKTVLLAAGVIAATNGKGPLLLIIAGVILGGMFVKMGCIDNAPHD